MGKTGMVISYHINKTYIAKVLCKNKKTPQMQCNGKCQLKKQLSEANTQQEKESVSVEKLPDVFWEINKEEAEAKEYFVMVSGFSAQTIFLNTRLPLFIFHPPAGKA
jgi:hypothetical protein